MFVCVLSLRWIFTVGLLLHCRLVWTMYVVCFFRNLSFFCFLCEWVYGVCVPWLTSGKFIAPVIVELSKQYPDVTTYKIDIDEVC